MIFKYPFSSKILRLPGLMVKEYNMYVCMYVCIYVFEKNIRNYREQAGTK